MAEVINHDDHDVDIHDPILHIHSEAIPNFAAAHTIHSAQSGDWEDPASWDLERVPNSSDVVVIKADHVITVMEDMEVDTIGVEGELIFEECGEETTFKTSMLLVYPSGGIVIGTPEQLYKNNLKFVISNKPINYAKDPKAHGTGIIVLGSFVVNGIQKSPFHRLAEIPEVGSNKIKLEETPVEWKVGDRIAIPDSTQYPLTKIASTRAPVPIPSRGEEFLITEIKGSEITLSSEIKHEHPGNPVDPAKKPHVANLTRNITFTSENPEGTRGHCMFTSRANVEISGAAFVSLGRTTAMPALDRFNPIGRYPVHFHHYMGLENPTNTGFQGSFKFSVIEDGPFWGLTLHGTHAIEVTDNVICKMVGAGLVTEQGNEVWNEIRRNFIFRIGQVTQSLSTPIYGGVSLGFKHFAWEGSGFWLAGLDNIVTDNVAADCKFSGFNFNGRAAGGFANNLPLVPKFRGADHSVPSHWINHKKPPKPAPSMRECRNNETYAAATAIWIGFSGNVGYIYDTYGWNIRWLGIYSARNHWIKWRGLKIHSDQEVAKVNQILTTGVDIVATSYSSGHLDFEDLEVIGFNQGIDLPQNIAAAKSASIPVDVPHTYTNVVLKNNVNIVERVASYEKMAIMKNISMERIPYGVKKPIGAYPTPMDIIRVFPNPGNLINVVVKSRLLIYPKVGTPFEYFMPEQHPDYVMKERMYPKTVRAVLQNCPTPGLTNQQCFIKHGVATLGRVATCTEKREGIEGFVCPIKD
jgi:hypothetical protein